MNNQFHTGKRSRRKNHKLKKFKKNFITTILCIVSILAIIFSFRLVQGSFDDDLLTNNNLSPSITETTKHQQVESDWRLLLVNRWNPIPDDFNVSLVKLKNGESVDKRIYADLQDMFNQARKGGLSPIVSSGYRTAEIQQSMFDEKVDEFQSQGYTKIKSEKMTEKWVAVPGTSEHQIGLAIDVADENSKNGTAVQQWLKVNSYKYGFILRYPQDKTDITGTNYEPWHFRYVGKETAAAIYQSGLCLEEYLKTLQ